MAVIKHNAYVENISAANLIRKIVSFLTTDEQLPNRMWTKEWFQDSDTGNEFPTEKLVYVLSKRLKNTSADEKMYAKIIFDPTEKSIVTLVSTKFLDADKNINATLTGSIKHDALDITGDVIIRDNKGIAMNPAGKTIAYAPVQKSILIPTLYFAMDFDMSQDRIKKAWIIRRLAPLFDEVTFTKQTDLYCWVTICTKEAGGTDITPLDQMGYYQHFGFGMCGESLVPDVSLKTGAGLYTCATSFASKTARLDEEDTHIRVYSGGGVDPAATPTNIGAVFCAGNLTQRIPKTDKANEDVEVTKLTWFYSCPAYGMARSPFDEAMFGFNNHSVGCPDNVGFDYTELCKYSPYSGVRVLTPAYVYGMYDNLYRVLGRLPVFYTQLTGLYAGDTISQEVDSSYKDYTIFPFINYRCLQEMESKRGHAIFTPSEETV